MRILSMKGLKLSKVTGLVGGPEWPTSVVCGILKLSLLQCCFETTPVILVCTPCVIAGAFMANPEATTREECTWLARTITQNPSEGVHSSNAEKWGTLATTMFMASMGIQLASATAAVYFILRSCTGSTAGARIAPRNTSSCYLFGKTGRQGML